MGRRSSRRSSTGNDTHAVGRYGPSPSFDVRSASLRGARGTRCRIHVVRRTATWISERTAREAGTFLSARAPRRRPRRRQACCERGTLPLGEHGLLSKIVETIGMGRSTEWVTWEWAWAAAWCCGCCSGALLDSRCSSLPPSGSCGCLLYTSDAADDLLCV